METLPQFSDCNVYIKDLARILNVNEKEPYRYIKDKNSELKAISYSTKKTVVSPQSIRNFRLKKNDVPKLINNGKFLAIYNAKGGVGKTLTAFNLSVRFSQLGMKVLIIDADMQTNTTNSFGLIENLDDNMTLLNIYEGADPANCVKEITPTIHLIPSNLSLGLLPKRIDMRNGYQTIRNSFEEISNEFDVVIFDCAPSINDLNYLILCAADIVLTPVFPESLSMSGLKMVISELERAKNFANVNNIHKVFINNLDFRENQSREYFTKYYEQFENIMMKITVRRSAELNSSFSSKIPIFSFKPNSDGACDYAMLAAELTNQEYSKQKGSH